LQRILELFSVILYFSVELIPHVWEVLLVAASDTQQNQPTEPNNMKALILLTQILACCAIGWFSVKAAILLHTFVHSY
jgi:hypothetical protein